MDKRSWSPRYVRLKGKPNSVAMGENHRLEPGMHHEVKARVQEYSGNAKLAAQQCPGV